MSYNLTNFEDRDSEFPNRRILTPASDSESENSYYITRDEGTIRKQGTPFNANTLKSFDEKIAAMFPVSVRNGGLNANTTKNDLGINQTINGTFINAKLGYIDNDADIGTFREISLKEQGTRTARYDKIGGFIVSNIHISGSILNPNLSNNIKARQVVIGKFKNEIIPSSYTVSCTIGKLAATNASTGFDTTPKRALIMKGSDHFKLFKGWGFDFLTYDDLNTSNPDGTIIDIDITAAYHV